LFFLLQKLTKDNNSLYKSLKKIDNLHYKLNKTEYLIKMNKFCNVYPLNFINSRPLRTMLSIDFVGF